MVRYHQFLVARYWVPEYGSSEDPEQFKYIYAYSPYHHVKESATYPAVLMVSGDSDTRVAPLHARKMTAMLQSVQDNPNPVLLKYDTEEKRCFSCFVDSYRVGFVSLRRRGETWEAFESRVRGMRHQDFPASAFVTWPLIVAPLSWRAVVPE